jgi:hypothetical protein
MDGGASGACVFLGNLEVSTQVYGQKFSNCKIKPFWFCYNGVMKLRSHSSTILQ